jgi:hypothetical protein
MWTYERTRFDPFKPLYMVIASEGSVRLQPTTPDDHVSYYRIFLGVSLWGTPKYMHFAVIK